MSNSHSFREHSVARYAFILISKFAKPGRDLYAIVASIQLLIFVYLLLFFTSMTRQSNGISDIIKLNQIPGGLVGALIAHVILMVFERYVTLRTPYVNEERKEYQQMADKQSKEK
jgi:TRAP-type C4-dicarboxylate transport system permease small subunit